MAKDFFVEIGTEELPPKALKVLAKAFLEGVVGGLQERQLAYKDSSWFATPRRLAVKVTELVEVGPDTETRVDGPPIAIAKDKQGNWSKAALGFAKRQGCDPEQLEEYNGKLSFNKTLKGERSVDVLHWIVGESLSKLPIPKRMRWGANRDEFVRPVHWSVMIYGDEIIPGTILGTQSSNQTRGHRFHCDTTLNIANPSVYEQLLEQDGHVIADFDRRRTMIREQVETESRKVGGIAVIDEDLLDEVTALVEWPVALAGSFEENFLAVPHEALISTMQSNQKYFPVVDKNGELTARFVFVANIVSNDPHKVIEGNERVIRPRFSDATFFFETDKQSTLESRVEQLKTIVFQEKLGTLFDKTQRVQKLAAFIAESIGANIEHTTRAALLCKTDLMTQMVLEFDNMQGIAGRYYALNDGETEEVADALRDQYLPRFSGDVLPESLTACVLAQADRLDTLVGIFGIGQPPTGSKDPFALRRASLSVLRILVEKQLALDLRTLLDHAKANYTSLPNGDGVVQNVLDYMIERFRAWYEEANIPVQVFQAVNAKQVTVPMDFDNRVKAVHAFYQMEEAEALASANKRVSNIITKQGGNFAAEFDKSLLTDAEEKTLANELAAKQKQVRPLFDAGNYREGLAQLASLRTSVDAFFDHVMVMVDDVKLRNNRLALLNQLRALFLEVADISLLVTSNKD